VREGGVPLPSGGRDPLTVAVAERFRRPVTVGVDGVDTLEFVDSCNLPRNW
jgi:hypothetical protein